MANQPCSRCMLAGWEHSRASRSPSLPLKSPTSATFTACSQLAYTWLKRHGRRIFISFLGTSTLPLSLSCTTQSGSPAPSHTLTSCSHRAHTKLTPRHICFPAWTCHCLSFEVVRSVLLAHSMWYFRITRRAFAALVQIYNWRLGDQGCKK